MFEQTLLSLTLSGQPGTAGPLPVVGPAAAMARQFPDTRKARPLGRWATGQDVARLRSVEGKPGWLVLLVLGHPSSVQQRAGGVEGWDYPWPASCRVWLKDGVCTGTFYTAGY